MRYAYGFWILLLFFLSSCDWFKASGAKEMPKFVIVNVLDKAQFDDCHIKGSINVPYEDIESYAEKHFDKENTQIVVHCSNYKCTASGASAKQLMDLGFKHVWAYEAGTAEAKKEGIPMQGPCKEAYLQDFAKPDGYDQLHAKAKFKIISTEELKKKMNEFALQ